LLKPSYLVLDLDYIKNIMTKDFQYFTDRGFYYNEKDDPLSAHLFAIGGQKWRNLRTKLTPTFTSGKMKMMFQTLVDCEPNLLQKIENDRVAKVPTDIKEALGCFTTDIIGSCAFGLDCNTFAEENSPFREYGRKVFNFNGLRLFKLTFSASFPKTAKILGVTQTPRRRLQLLHQGGQRYCQLSREEQLHSQGLSAVVDRSQEQQTCRRRRLQTRRRHSEHRRNRSPKLCLLHSRFRNLFHYDDFCSVRVVQAPGATRQG
jgi:hypothetical protein